jgi:hypothetical protein
MTPAYYSEAAPEQAIRAVSHSARSRGVAAFGAPGVGKSRFFGRGLAIQDFVADIPQVIIDPIGSTIDNFLDKVVELSTYLPRCEAAKLFGRIIYCDMSGSNGFAVPFPLYYRVGTERSLWEIAERYPQALAKSDPSLLTRPIMGWPPLHKIGVYTGMILAALGYQITEVSSLLQQPEQWEDRLQQAENRYPTVAEAVAFFREYRHLRKAERERLTTAFGEKIFPISLDRRLQAIFGAQKPGIEWDTVERKRQTVLIDFRHVRDTEMRRFQLLWVFSYLSEWIKARGRSQIPFGVIIDEFPALTLKVGTGDNPLAQDLDTFIHEYMRQHTIWLTIGLQSPLQLDRELQQTVLSLGTYLIGQAPTMQAARLLADATYRRDPFWVKHYRNVWGKDHSWEPLQVIDTEPEYMPLEQQTEVFANRIMRLKQYQFFLRPAVDEGTIGNTVYPISIRTIDPGRFPSQEILTPLRKSLAIKAGKRVTALLAEQAARKTLSPVTHAPHPHQQSREQSLPSTTDAEPAAIQPAAERPRRLLQRRQV